MSLVTIIPARLNSTRLHKKLLLPLGDTIVLNEVYQLAKVVTRNRTFVASPDEEILSVCDQYGIPKVRIFNSVNGTDCVAKAAAALELEPHTIVLNWQADHIIPIKDIERAKVSIDTLFDFVITSYKMGTLYFRSSDPGDRNRVKIVMVNGEAKYFSRADIPFSYSGKKQMYNIHTGLYMFENRELQQLPAPNNLSLAENLEQLAWLEHRIRCVHGPEFYSIDTREDYVRASEAYISR